MNDYLEFKEKILYILDRCYQQFINQNNPYIEDLILFIHELTDQGKIKSKKDNPNETETIPFAETFGKLVKLQLQFPNINEIDYIVAVCYQFGIGVEKNIKSAQSILEQLANRNYSPAQADLASLYNSDLLGKPDPELALEFLKQSIFKNGTQRQDAATGAIFQYGTGLYNGALQHIKFETDKKVGFEFMQFAADNGNANAQYAIGDILLKQEDNTSQLTDMNT